AIRSSGSILTFWRPVLLAQKPGGKAKTPRLLRDLIRTKSREKGLHEWQQPIEEAALFVRTLSEPGDLIADLCVCTGSVPAAVATVPRPRASRPQEAKRPRYEPVLELPPLPPEQFEALRDNIAIHGVLVPILVDGDGPVRRIIDGNHRKQIADELGYDCPEIVK